MSFAKSLMFSLLVFANLEKIQSTWQRIWDDPPMLGQTFQAISTNYVGTNFSSNFQKLCWDKLFKQFPEIILGKTLQAISTNWQTRLDTRNWAILSSLFKMLVFHRENRNFTSLSFWFFQIPKR